MRLSRYLAFVPEALLLGLHFARFKFMTRAPAPIPPEVVWRSLATPSRAIRRLEDLHPSRLQLWAFVELRALTMRFASHAKSIGAHYDLSNDFFCLFLDKNLRFYSAADGMRPGMTLEEGQEVKAQRLVALIDPKPGQRILDLGSGWGGMLDRMVKATGGRAEVVGYTLSREQQQFTRETYGLDVEIRDFITTDYPPESFDTIYAIETFEHVRRAEMPAFARKLRRALKPDGRLVFQLTCLPHADEVPPRAALFVGIDTFPDAEGSCVVGLSRVFEEAGFRIAQTSLLDYRPTLRAWFENLAAHGDEAVAMVGLENYLRFLCYLAGAYRLFDGRELAVARFVAEPA